MVVDATFGAPSASARSQPKMAFAMKAWRMEVPLGPLEASIDDIAPSWVEIDRDARKPLLVRASDKLRKLAITLDVANEDGTPVTAFLDGLILLANPPVTVTDPVSVIYDPLLASTMWHITSCSVRIVEREPGTNEPTQATVDLTLTEASSADIELGPIATPKTVTQATNTTTTGTTGTATVSVSGSMAGEGARSPTAKRQGDRTFTWFASETIEQFALKTTGDASNWTVIAQYNKIAPNFVIPGHTHPQTSLKVPEVMTRLAPANVALRATPGPVSAVGRAG